MLEVLSTACGRSAQRYPGGRHDEEASRLAQRAEKSPSLVIEENPELMRFGARHSLVRATLAASIPTQHRVRPERPALGGASMRGDSLAHGAARSEKSPSLLIEKNPVSNAFGARHSVCVRHSCALPSYATSGLYRRVVPADEHCPREMFAFAQK